MARMMAFLVGILLFIAVVHADYCVIVLDNNDVYNVSDLTLSAFLPVNADDIIGSDIPGNDLPDMPLFYDWNETNPLGSQCRAACGQNSLCKYYAYDVCATGQGACWLKTEMSAPRDHGCRAYGIMTNSIPHNIGGGNYTMNLCRATSCGRFSNCQLCQNVGSPPSQYCTGNDAGAVYSVLEYPWNIDPVGYEMSFYGDASGCPGGRPRESVVHVVCNQPQNRFVFVDEPTTCKYYYEAYLTGNCSFVPPVPTIAPKSQSKTSVRIQLNTDSHLFNLDYSLSITYNLWRDGDLFYSGPSNMVVVDLPDLTGGAPGYTFTAQATYNGRASVVSAPYLLQPVTTLSTADQVTQDMIAVLGNTVDRTTQDISDDIHSISTRLDVDLIQVVRQNGIDTLDLREKVYVINNTTLVNIASTQSNMGNTLSNIATTQGKVQTTVNGYSDRFTSLSNSLSQLSTSVSQLSSQVNNQSAVIQALQSQQGQSSGGSSGGVSGAGIAVGMLIGIIVGVVGALFGPKLFQKLSSSGPRGEGRY